MELRPATLVDDLQRTEDAEFHRLDPATGNVVETIRIGGHPSGIAVGANRVWVTVS